MHRTKLGKTDLQIFPLCLGGNVFGWTADEAQSFAVLDRYAAAGGNFVDTADVYSAWAPGNTGGESETIIGRWMASRGCRDQIVVATKVGVSPHRTGLRADNILAAADDSLRRLGTDHIDLYYAHSDDTQTPLSETLGAFDKLVRAGKVRYIAASNYTAPRLREALEISQRDGLARYAALQPHYNLVHRSAYEGELRDLCEREGVACLPYYALAKGFLTGKYRPGVDVQGPRAAGASAYLDERGLRLLDILDELAAAHGTTVSAVALAWLLSQPTVAAPIASARNAQQLDDLLPVAGLTLSADEVARLTAA